MGIENFGKRIGRKIVTGVVAAGTFLTPQTEASQEAIAKAKTDVVKTRFDQRIARAKTPKDIEKLEQEKALALVEAAVEEAKAKDRDESAQRLNQPVSDPDREFGRPYKEEKDIVASSKVEIDILDKDGKVIGKKTIQKGSKEWKKLKELEIKKETGVEKEKARASRPIILGDGTYIDGGGYNTIDNQGFVPVTGYRRGYRGGRRR